MLLVSGKFAEVNMHGHYYFEAAGSDALELIIEKSYTTANAWTRLKKRYAPSTLTQIAGIQEYLHETRMDVSEDPIHLLSVFEDKKALELPGNIIGDRQLLVLHRVSLPDEYSVEATQLDASLDLDNSMTERLIGARYCKMSEGGETGLVARRYGPRGRDHCGARSKGLPPTKGSDRGRSRG